MQNDEDDKCGLEELRALWHELVLDAQHIPHVQRLAPRPHKAGQMDLTAARLFWQCKEKQRNLVRILERWYGHKTIGAVRVHTIVATFLYAFSALHTLFALRRPLVDAEAHQAQELTSRVGKAWATLKWKSTRWVHWIVCHSARVLRMHRSMHIFSSIPTEHRNSKFKVRIKNSMRGWCLRNLRLSERAMCHVVNMETLDVALCIRHQKARAWHLWRARSAGGKSLG